MVSRETSSFPRVLVGLTFVPDLCYNASLIVSLTGERPMSKLKSAALAYARAGLPVFPIKPNEKTPLTLHGHKNATTDLARIEKWWTEYPDANIATVPGDVDMLVIDVDPGGDDKPYPETAKWSRTPRDGFHLWYHVSPDEHIPNSASKIAANVDVRGHDGYVLLPPSSTEHGPYEWGENTRAAPAPAWLVEQAKATGGKAKSENAMVWRIEPDKPEHIARAREAAAGNGPLALYPANEGHGGDQATYEAACMMRSFGLSQGTALEVLFDVYNQRCNPPWEWDALETKVANAYEYATSPPGNCTDEYQRIRRREAVEVFRDTTTGDTSINGRFRVLDRRAMDQIKPPEWLLHDMLPQGAYTMLFGPPGSYKTFLALDIALTIAAGFSDWLDGRAILNNGPVLYVAGEGRASMTQRVRAWELAYNHGELVREFILADPVPNVEPNFDQFMDAAGGMRNKYSLIVLDTVGRALAGANENSQEIASKFTSEVSKLQYEFDATVLALHHTGHQGKDATMRERGSSVFRADVDTMLGLWDQELHMVKQKDAELWAKPIPLKIAKSGKSIVLGRAPTDTPPKPKSQEPTKDDRQEAAALEADDLAAALLGQMNVGMRLSQTQMGERMAGMSIDGKPSGKKGSTWYQYLSILKTKDTKTRKFYDENTGEWVNRGIKQ
jgi:hypothetical protein